MDEEGQADRSMEEVEDVECNNKEPARRTRSFADIYKIAKRKAPEFTMIQTLLLGYQSLGVVYGDIGTSPLYVFSSVALENPTERDILGLLSLIFWTLTMIALIKYVSTVLHINDHGEGGTFALYSLIRQHICFKGTMIMPTRLESDINLRFHSGGSKLHYKAQKFLEGNGTAQTAITLIVLLGTCMVIGDGALTPAISVLTAVQGIQTRSSKITTDIVVLLCVAILLVLFLCQRFGTSRVSFTFSPIMLLWFGFNAVIGIYNIAKYYPLVLKALSPHYIYYFFKMNGKKGWELLGATTLCVTGAEAMFADLGHFNKKAIQLSFSFLVYPALVLAYAGEAAYLIKNPENLSTTFYSAMPEPMFWVMFVISTLSAIVASQALISASFSIIRQSNALGCFPRVTMTHTSDKHEGQIYSPEINLVLMILSITITVYFKGGVEIGNAYGVAVIWVMLITTFLTSIVMIVIWDTNSILIAIFLIVFVGIEGVYMTSLLNKLTAGGWVPFAISAFFLVITLSWTYGRSKKTAYEARNKMDLAELNELIMSSVRVPGMCFFCTDLMNGIPPIVRHYVRHIGSLRQVMVFVTIRTLPVKSVLPEERFHVAKLGPYGIYRCLVQYGYMDEHSMEGDEYVQKVIAALKEIAENDQEIHMLDSALTSGSIFVLGRIILKMSNSKNWFGKFVIDYLYRFLQKNFRSNIATLRIPLGKILHIGMVYEIE